MARIRNLGEEGIGTLTCSQAPDILLADNVLTTFLHQQLFRLRCWEFLGGRTRFFLASNLGPGRLRTGD